MKVEDEERIAAKLAKTMAMICLRNTGAALPLNGLCLNLCGGTITFSPAAILNQLDHTSRL